MKSSAIHFICFLLIAILTKSNLFAQDKTDYVITNQNDTIRCTILHPVFGRLKYRPENSSDIFLIKPDSIKEYKTAADENPMVAVKIPFEKDKEFMERLEFGPISLFELRTTTTDNYNPYYYSPYYRMRAPSGTVINWYAIKKGVDSVFSIKTNLIDNYGTNVREQRNAFGDLIADNIPVAAKYNRNFNYDMSTIRNLIKEYNQMTGPAKDYIITEKNDTLICRIAEYKTGTSSNFTYQTANSVNFAPLNTDAVKEFRAGQSVFVKRKFTDDSTTRFVLWIERGKINLFQLDNADNDVRFYASKDNEPLAEIISTTSRSAKSRKEKTQAFYDLIGDEPQLLKKFKRLTYDGVSNDVVHDIVMEYNKLHDEQ